MRDWTPIDVLPEILNDVPDLVFAYTADGRYLFINHAASRFLGAKPIDVIGRHWSELGYSAAVMGPLTERLDAVARTGRPEHHRVVTSPERGERVLDMALTPLWSEEGHVLAILAIAHDISEFFATPPRAV